MPVKALRALLGLKGLPSLSWGSIHLSPLGPRAPFQLTLGPSVPVWAMLQECWSPAQSQLPHIWPLSPSLDCHPQTDLLSCLALTISCFWDITVSHFLKAWPSTWSMDWLPILSWHTSLPQTFLMIWILGWTQSPSPGMPNSDAGQLDRAWPEKPLPQTAASPCCAPTIPFSKQISICHQQGSLFTNSIIKLTLPALENAKYTEVEQHDLMDPPCKAFSYRSDDLHKWL